MKKVGGNGASDFGDLSSMCVDLDVPETGLDLVPQNYNTLLIKLKTSAVK